MQVDISGLANDISCAAADCVNFEGTYVVPLTVSGGSGCVWSKSFTLSPTACGESSLTVSVFIPAPFFPGTILVEFLFGGIGFRANFRQAQTLPFDCESPPGTAIAYANESPPNTPCNWSGGTCLLTAL